MLLGHAGPAPRTSVLEHLSTVTRVTCLAMFAIYLLASRWLLLLSCRKQNVSAIVTVHPFHARLIMYFESGARGTGERSSAELRPACRRACRVRSSVPAAHPRASEEVRPRAAQRKKKKCHSGIMKRGNVHVQPLRPRTRDDLRSLRCDGRDGHNLVP